MDEVLAVGDVIFRQKSIGRMLKETESGKTTIYVSHNLNSVRQLCDRCMVLQEGKMVYLGDTETAIGVYLNSILNDSVKRDISEIPRSTRLTDRRMILTMAEYVGKDSIRFDDGEKMKMHLHWENLADYEDLCVRVEVWNIEDVLQASGVLYDVCSGRARD